MVEGQGGWSWPGVHWPGPSFSFLQARVTLPSVLACQPPSQAPVGQGEGQSQLRRKEGADGGGMQRGSRMDSIRLKR